MLSKSLVSIILPTYNRLEYLQRSIGSVLSQTYQDWELIIWDDGSDDGTNDYCQSLRDQRIRYFWHENEGISFARNRAIERSRGEFIAFLDSDDEWMSNKLDLQVAIMQSHSDIDFLFSNFVNHNLSTKEKNLAFMENSDAFRQLELEKMNTNLWKINNGWLESLTVADYVATDTIMLKKSVLGLTGGYDESLRNSVDFELKWRMGYYHVSFAFTDDVLLVRNKPQGSLSSLSLSTVKNYIKALNICEQTSLSFGRKDMAASLNPLYRNAWQNMITACAMEKDRKGMMEAFKNSMKYGFRPGSLRLLIEGLLKIGAPR